MPKASSGQKKENFNFVNFFLFLKEKYYDCDDGLGISSTMEMLLANSSRSIGSHVLSTLTFFCKKKLLESQNF